MPFPLTYLLLALIAVNLLTFAMFQIDKSLARSGGWRIRESTLLWLAFLGGTPGAYAARSLFRHKTRKQPFSNYLFAIATLQTVGLGGWIGWQFAG